MLSVGTKDRESAEDKRFAASVRLVRDVLARAGLHHRAALASDQPRCEPPAEMATALGRDLRTFDALGVRKMRNASASVKWSFVIMRPSRGCVQRQRKVSMPTP